MAASYFYSYLHLVSSPTVHNRRAGLSPLLCLTGVLGSTKTSQVSSGRYRVMLGGGHRGALQASSCTRTGLRAHAATRYAVLRVMRPDPAAACSQNIPKYLIPIRIASRGQRQSPPWHRVQPGEHTSGRGDVQTPWGRRELSHVKFPVLGPSLLSTEQCVYKTWQRCQPPCLSLTRTDPRSVPGGKPGGSQNCDAQGMLSPWAR